MSARWGLIVEETEGVGNGRTTTTNVLEEVTGTREQAMTRLQALARSHQPSHPSNASRTRLYRTDDGYLLVSEGAMRNYGCRFSVAELLYDSEEAERAAAAARRAEREERAARKAAERAARRARRGSR